jgi:phosphoribosylglycinamide formyltransferase-1
MTSPLRLAVLLSGSGRTLANLLEWIAEKRLQAEIVCVISNRPGVRGLAIAERAGVPTYVLPRDGQPPAAWSDSIFGVCRARRADLVVMAGFLQLVEIPADFAGRVLNIHPALLPAFGGKGFHGMHVHRAVLERGCTVSGCTVHLVDNEYDHGRILVQKTVPVLADDTADSLAARVFAAECTALPEAIAAFGTGLVASSLGKAVR